MFICVKLKKKEVDNKALTPIVANLEKIYDFGNRTVIDSFTLSDLLAPMQFDKYFRYAGSLTTPACDEVVEWILIENPVLEISEDQLLEFQSVLSRKGFPVITLLFSLIMCFFIFNYCRIINFWFFVE